MFHMSSSKSKVLIFRSGHQKLRNLLTPVENILILWTFSFFKIESLIFFLEIDLEFTLFTYTRKVEPFTTRTSHNQISIKKRVKEDISRFFEPMNILRITVSYFKLKPYSILRKTFIDVKCIYFIHELKSRHGTLYRSRIREMRDTLGLHLDPRNKSSYND